MNLVRTWTCTRLRVSVNLESTCEGNARSCRSRTCNLRRLGIEELLRVRYFAAWQSTCAFFSLEHQGLLTGYDHRRSTAGQVLPFKNCVSSFSPMEASFMPI